VCLGFPEGRSGRTRENVVGVLVKVRDPVRRQLLDGRLDRLLGRRKRHRLSEEIQCFPDADIRHRCRVCFELRLERDPSLSQPHIPLRGPLADLRIRREPLRPAAVTDRTLGFGE
jgi:hypothetical protein